MTLTTVLMGLLCVGINVLVLVFVGIAFFRRVAPQNTITYYANPPMGHDVER
jgi:hypothetical protein